VKAVSTSGRIRRSKMDAEKIPEEKKASVTQQNNPKHPTTIHGENTPQNPSSGTGGGRTSRAADTSSPDDTCFDLRKNNLVTNCGGGPNPLREGGLIWLSRTPREIKLNTLKRGKGDIPKMPTVKEKTS